MSELEESLLPAFGRHPTIEFARYCVVEALAYREVWGLVVAKCLSDGAWFYYMFWLPKYLYDVRGFDTKQVGYYAWIPYAAAGVGSLLGGWFSSWLIGRGWSLNMARKAALARARR